MGFIASCAVGELRRRLLVVGHVRRAEVLIGWCPTR